MLNFVSQFEQISILYLLVEHHHYKLQKPFTNHSGHLLIEGVFVNDHLRDDTEHENTDSITCIDVPFGRGQQLDDIRVAE